MSDAQKNSSFANAFVPGLILGLVIGAAAGAFLPDLLGGSNIPTPDANAVPADRTPEVRDGMEEIDPATMPEIDPETGLPVGETPDPMAEPAVDPIAEPTAP